MLIVMIFHYQLTISSEKQLLLEQGRSNTQLMSRIMVARLNEMIADVRILSDQLSAGVSSPSANHLEKLFIRFALHKPNYAQIRFLDVHGNELVRINHRDKTPEAVPDSGLQNKFKRYYFQQGRGLKPGQVYLSAFDLNEEQGRVELPANPTLRAVSSVYGSDNVLQGVLVVNLLGNDWVEETWSESSLVADTITLSSEKGYITIDTKSVGKQAVFMSHHPLISENSFVAERLKNEISGELIDDSILFSYATLIIDGVYGHRQWKVITTLDASGINIYRKSFLYNTTPLYGIILLIISVASFANTRHQQRYYQTLAHRDYERSFRMLLEDIDLAAVNIDKQGVILFCNRYFLRSVGYSYAEVIGKNWLHLFMPCLPNERGSISLSSLFNQAQANGEESTQQQIKKKNSEHCIFQWTFTLQEYDGHNFLSLVGKDITKQLGTEEQLNKLTYAVEQSANTVMITDQEGTVAYVNRAFSTLTGYSSEEIIGQNPNLLKSGETSADEYAALWEALRSGQSWRGEFHNRKKNGELFWESALISPVRSPNGNSGSYIAIKQDITEEKRLQAELDQQLEETIKNKQLAAIGRMANMIVHDLRNPLSSVKMAFQMSLRKPGIDDESRELFDISLEQTAYMEHILEDLLSYSRPDELSVSNLKINQLIDFVLKGQQELIYRRSVELALMLSADLPEVEGDRIKLCQALQNLVLNALQAADFNGHGECKVTIKSSLVPFEDGERLVVSITNTGRSITDQESIKAFEIFHTTKAKGTGLGLSIVERIIKQHKGTVRLYGIPDYGSCAEIHLPLNKEYSRMETEAVVNG